MVVEWPDGLLPYGMAWEAIREGIGRRKPDVLITNEMPFGCWAPVMEDYSSKVADSWVSLHEEGLEALASLDVGVVISSRPVKLSGRLANEGFSLVNGHYRSLHHKHFFPQEQGWFEESWFCTGLHGFSVHEIDGIKIGFQLCTELMFNEYSRHLGRLGADLIVAPRATGQRTDNWLFAAQMAAFVGGCFVASSNRQGSGALGAPQFGGMGFIIDPAGKILLTTDDKNPMVVLNLDFSVAKEHKSAYPCYVKDFSLR